MKGLKKSIITKIQKTNTSKIKAKINEKLMILKSIKEIKT